MILLQGRPPLPPIPPQAQPPFAPCSFCVPIDEFVIVLLFVALLYGMYKLVSYDDNNKRRG